MWTALPLAVTALSAFGLWWAMRGFRSWGTRYLIGIVWLRYALAAIPDVTYTPVAAGLSINALVSIVAVGGGFFVINRSLLLLKYVAPVYAFMAVIAVSAAVNGPDAGVINTLTKWGYFLVVALLTYDAVKTYGADRLFARLSVAFIAPLTLQYLSFLLRYAKATESDGSVSYIGSYSHEAVLSTIVLTFIVLLSFGGAGRKLLARVFFIGLGVFGLLLANYRTSILAAGPALSVFFFRGSLMRIVPEQRPLVAVAVLFAFSGLLAFVGVSLGERFADIGAVFGDGFDLFKAPYYFTSREQDLLSARVYLWSRYIHGYLEGDLLNYLFGYGPNSWEGVFPKYAHNTFVSCLYEFGIVGVIALAAIFSQSLFGLIWAPDRATAFSLLAANFGFLLLCMATMPLWLMEGIILFGFITGYAWREMAAGRARFAPVKTDGVNIGSAAPAQL